MKTGRRVEFTLAIDPGSEPIAGAIDDGRGQSVEFSGWLGFAAALEELLSSLSETTPVPEPPVP